MANPLAVPPIPIPVNVQSVVIPLEFYSASFGDSQQDIQTFRELFAENGISFFGVESNSTILHCLVPLNNIQCIPTVMKKLENAGFKNPQIRFMGTALNANNLLERGPVVQQIHSQSQNQTQTQSQSPPKFYAKVNYRPDELYQVSEEQEKHYAKIREQNGGKYPLAPPEDDDYFA